MDLIKWIAKHDNKQRFVDGFGNVYSKKEALKQYQSKYNNEVVELESGFIGIGNKFKTVKIGSSLETLEHYNDKMKKKYPDEYEVLKKK